MSESRIKNQAVARLSSFPFPSPPLPHYSHPLKGLSIPSLLKLFRDLLFFSCFHLFHVPYPLIIRVSFSLSTPWVHARARCREEATVLPEPEPEPFSVLLCRCNIVFSLSFPTSYCKSCMSVRSLSSSSAMSENARRDCTPP